MVGFKKNINNTERQLYIIKYNLTVILFQSSLIKFYKGPNRVKKNHIFRGIELSTALTVGPKL